MYIRIDTITFNFKDRHATMNPYYTTINYLDDLQKHLNEIAPGSFIAPAHTEDKKRPLVKHKDGQYTINDYHKHKWKCFRTGTLIILSKDLIVVDVDDQEYVQKYKQMFPIFNETVSAKTKKGMHFFFKTTEYSRAARIFDGARSMKDPDTGEVLPVDIKTVCSTGTGGIIAIAPSPNKEWIVEPIKNKILDLPDEFVDHWRYRTAAKDTAPEPAENTGKGATGYTTNNTYNQKNTKYDAEEVKGLLDALSFERCDNYSTWIQVGMCLHNTDPGEHMLELWDEFSQKSLKYTEGECAEKWTTFGNAPEGRGLTLASLYAWAKQDNHYAYKEVINGRVYKKIIECNGSHNAVAEIASRLLKDRYRCSNAKTNTWYFFDGTLWKQDPEGVSMRNELSHFVREQIYMAFNKYVNRQLEDERRSQAGSDASGNNPEERRSAAGSCSDRSQEILDKCNEIAYKLQDKRFKDCVVAEMREYMLESNFEDKLDSRIHLLAFTNGVWDLEAGHFRAAVPDDYVSISVGYPYSDEVDPALTRKVVEYWEKLHPNKDQREYILKTFARQLYGDSGRELFHVHAGHKATAANGKTKCFLLLEKVLGEYVRKTQVSILTAKNREEASKPQPEYAYWRGRRILYVTEPEQSECLHSGIVKDLTGGERIIFRLLHSNTYASFTPQFKFSLLCNDPPKLDGTDDGMRRRMRKVDYVSRFVEADQVDEANHRYKIDASLFMEAEASIPLRMAFLKHLLGYFDLGYNFEMPEGIRKTCECYLKDNDGVSQFVEEFIMKSDEKDAHFTLKQAKEMFQRQEYFNRRIGTLKTDLEKILHTVCFDSKRIKSVLHRNVFLGYNLHTVDDFLED